MKGLAGIKIPTKEVEQVCPIHKIRLEQFGNKPPFCRKCVEEQIEKQKKNQIIQFNIDSVKGVLRHDSLIDDPMQYDYTFDTFKAIRGSREGQIKHGARLTAGKYIKFPNNPLHTIFYGLPGEGKTHLAMSMLNAINQYSDPPQKCLFVDVNNLFDRVVHSFNDPTALWTQDYAIKKLSSVDVLVLDDLGSESAMNVNHNNGAGNFIQKILKKVLDKQKRIIFTTNLTKKQLEQTYNPKLVSRMFQYSRGNVFDFSGIKDKRY